MTDRLDRDLVGAGLGDRLENGFLVERPVLVLVQVVR